MLHDYWPDEFVKTNERELGQDNDVPFFTDLLITPVAARRPNEQVKDSKGLRCVQNEQLNKRQFSVHLPLENHDSLWALLSKFKGPWTVVQDPDFHAFMFD